ncbi:phage GP46 family protein [Desulfovibrio sp.]|uniref:phage GP46 family protein n=1 Tax=Desulfovibrio sp. TaxID=885 RepID=UPI003AB1ACE8
MDICLHFDQEHGLFDALLSGPLADLQGDDGLMTAVIISLFTDARAHDDDPLPDERVGVSSDRRGWWGDCLPDAQGEQTLESIGSRLWLLWREKDLDSVVARARQYAEEALAWLTREGHVSSLSVSVERVQPGHLGISVAVQPSGSDDPGREWRFTYDYQQAQPVSVRLEA